MSTTKLYTPTEIEYLKVNYPIKGPKQCAEEMGRTTKGVHEKGRRLGLAVSQESLHQILSYATAKTKTKYETPVTVETFRNVRTAEVAYILGLLWADGHVRKEKIVLECVKEDALDYMKTFETTGTWRHSDRTQKRYGVTSKPQRTIRLGHTGLATYLISKGYGAKSSISACEILKTVPDHLKSYWFRGLFDGDGSLTWSNKLATMCIGSTYDQDWLFLENFCKSNEVEYTIERRIFKKGNKGSYLVVRKAKSIINFFCAIYKNREKDEIGLNRKYKKWRDVVELSKQRRNLGYLFEHV